MDLIERRFSKLLVLKIHSKGHSTFWKCLCDCGNQTIATTNQLTSGGKKSCGCLRKELTKTLRARSGGNTKPKGQAYLNKIYYEYQLGAKNRNLNFLLTKEEFKNIVSQNCHYCGALPLAKDNRRKDGSLVYNGSYPCNGIDRVNNSFAYIIANVVPCCKKCNFMKTTLGYDEFIAQCERICENMRGH